MIPSRNPYPINVCDDEWAFVAPYLTLLPEDAEQSSYSLREVFNGLRWIVRTGPFDSYQPVHAKGKGEPMRKALRCTFDAAGVGRDG